MTFSVCKKRRQPQQMLARFRTIICELLFPTDIWTMMLPLLLSDDLCKTIGKRLDLVLVLALDDHAALWIGTGIPYVQSAGSSGYPLSRVQSKTA
jgi:hypothetical protein